MLMNIDMELIIKIILLYLIALDTKIALVVKLEIISQFNNLFIINQKVTKKGKETRILQKIRKKWKMYQI